MARYVFLLLLVNVYYCGFGVSLPTDILISKLLMKLQSDCPYPSIAEMIDKRINECHVVAPPYGAQELQCLMFYDINSQLCSVDQKSLYKHTVPADIEIQISSPQTVDELCNNTKLWRYSKLPMHALYLPSVMETLASPQSCKAVCAQESTDTATDLCKYFKVLTELLKSYTNTVSILSKKQETSSGAQLDTIKTSTNEAKVIADKSEPEVPFSSSVKNENLDKLLPVSVSTEKLSANDIQAKPEKLDKKLEESQPLETQIKPLQDGNASLQNQETPDKIEKPLTNNQNIDKTDKQVEKDPNNNVQNELIKPPLKIKQDKDGFDYNDQEDVKDGIADSQGDDDPDDPDMDNDGRSKIKSSDVNKNVAALLPVDTELTQLKEPTYQDGFTEEDDHFFSFFLTAVILVVLLYVLYHNKNKVLGLIVEGRQNGRRRNSRGHAYRRLDTLEQAMSSNTTTPPSKIIY